MLPLHGLCSQIIFWLRCLVSFVWLPRHNNYRTASLNLNLLLFFAANQCATNVTRSTLYISEKLTSKTILFLQNTILELLQCTCRDTKLTANNVPDKRNHFISNSATIGQTSAVVSGLPQT